MRRFTSRRDSLSTFVSVFTDYGLGVSGIIRQRSVMGTSFRSVIAPGCLATKLKAADTDSACNGIAPVPEKTRRFHPRISRFTERPVRSVTARSPVLSVQRTMMTGSPEVQLVLRPRRKSRTRSWVNLVSVTFILTTATAAFRAATDMTHKQMMRTKYIRSPPWS